VRRLAAACLALAACKGGAASPDLARMKRQHRPSPYAASPLFSDGRAMRTPPAGTIPRGATLAPALAGGVVGGAYLARPPLPVTRALVERGRDRYDVYCAVCHGVFGDGDAAVASVMELRRPPSLLHPTARAFPPGRLFQVVSRGYGLMPSYDEALSVEDRWAVVAYVRALQLAQGVPLDALPPPLRADARRALP
jgi:mono/diheme cytochrome c family protein